MLSDLFLQSMAEQRHRDLIRAAERRPSRRRKGYLPVPSAAWFLAGWVFGAFAGW